VASDATQPLAATLCLSPMQQTNRVSVEKLWNCAAPETTLSCKRGLVSDTEKPDIFGLQSSLIDKRVCLPTLAGDTEIMYTVYCASCHDSSERAGMSSMRVMISAALSHETSQPRPDLVIFPTLRSWRSREQYPRVASACVDLHNLGCVAEAARQIVLMYDITARLARHPEP
jgi:hypothetical protein